MDQRFALSGMTRYLAGAVARDEAPSDGEAPGTLLR